ncbi:ribonuclease H [Sesbania bispinosa]|nr:ribonuclease H [Sesbania bispinosa]
MHPSAEIRYLLARNWKVELRHTLREGNACADLLAKKGTRSSSSLTLIDSAPPEAHHLLLSDAMGIAFLRR